MRFKDYIAEQTKRPLIKVYRLDEADGVRYVVKNTKETKPSGRLSGCYVKSGGAMFGTTDNIRKAKLYTRKPAAEKARKAVQELVNDDKNLNKKNKPKFSVVPAKMDIIEEGSNRILNEVRLGGELYDLDSYDLIEFAKKWAGLGDAVQEQVDDILNDPNANVNPNAIRLAQERIGGYNEEIDNAIAEYYEVRQG